jgi:glutamyl-tRNA synthetase
MEKLILDGNGYADNGTAEEMKDQRDNGIESPHRQKTPQETLEIFKGMLAGEKEGWCIRGKMNMQDKFKCLRDPVFYRCKNDEHHRHGNKYKAYPTYHFACPIVDSLEGVTHAMRTIEYHDYNGGYYWLLKVLGLREDIIIYDYSRLNLVSTVLSKRNLAWFVEQGIADGWNDPRFPTVQGMIRRGLNPESLKRFMLEQGPSKNTNLMEWDKIWAYNKEAIDAKSSRYTAIVKETQARFIISNGPSPITTEKHLLHQKNADLGEKNVYYGKELLVEEGDAVDIEVGEKVTLMKWGNCVITNKETVDGKITLTGELKIDDKDFKKTKKLTWITNDPTTSFEVTLVELDHIITKKKVEDNESVKDIVNLNSRIAYTAIAEQDLS